ncbi:MAG: hypothetical protein QM702_00260 [Rubrivivax sp.]
MPENIEGLEQLLRTLGDVPVKLERNVLRGSLRAGAKVQLLAGRESAPVEEGGEHPGALRKSGRIVTSSRGGVVKASVKFGDKVAFYARMVATGTKAHVIRAKGAHSLFFGGRLVESVQHPGAKANNWLKGVLDGTSSAAVAAVAEYMRKRMTKEGIKTPGPEGN